MPTCRKVSKWWIYSIINQLSTIYRNKTKTKQETLQRKRNWPENIPNRCVKKKTCGFPDFWVSSQLLMISRLFFPDSLLDPGKYELGWWWGRLWRGGHWHLGFTLVRDSLSKGCEDVTPSSGFPCLVFLEALRIKATFERSKKSESQF